jgi:hypothetical protein
VAPSTPLKEGQSIHYVYVCRKIEGADDVATEKWPDVEA